jgi:prevent-host-death family protein
LETVYNIHEAKTSFSKLIERVRQGEDIVIVKAGRPVARLVPIRPTKQRQPGNARNLVTMSEDFDAALPDALLNAFKK